MVWVFREIKAKGNGSVLSVSRAERGIKSLQEIGTLAITIIQIPS